MSVNVLVIPEDFRKDQFMLKPIVERMMKELGVRARVRVCQDPLLGGISEATKKDSVEQILERYQGMVRVFLLLVDRDGKEGRRQALDSLEAFARRTLGDSDRVFLGENAWQEVEVWVLAGMRDLPKDWRWAQVRKEGNPKEVWYLPYAGSRGLADGPYEGRDVLGKEAAANYSRIRQLCPEVAELEQRIRQELQA